MPKKEGKEHLQTSLHQETVPALYAMIHSNFEI